MASVRNGISNTYNYLSSFFKSPDDPSSLVIDFTYTPYDPLNKTHRDYIEGKINHLAQTRTALLKTDAFIGLPLGLYTLFVVPNAGLITDILLLAGTLYFLSASEQFQNHSKFKTQFEKDRAELLSIYKAIIKTKGAIITGDQTFLKLAEALKPMVDSLSLIKWDDNQTYPNNDFSEKFAELMEEPPHKIPRAVLKGNAPIAQEETQFSQTNIVNSLVGTPGKKWFALYNTCKAELYFTLYGQKEKSEQIPEQPSLLRQFGFKQ